MGEERSSPTPNAKAIGRSLDTYYRDAARNARMDELNRAFIPQSGLAFDIGAHVGDRTASFLRLGASVVALEPQPIVFRALSLIHGLQPKAMLYRAAAGARAGTMLMRLNSENPTVSTLSPELVETAQTAPGWSGQIWDKSVSVPVTTLDTLIARHGQPDFIKIDVEGYELEVLRGLSVPLPALSFEMTIIQRDVALACVHYLSNLRSYEYNFSFGEDHKLQHPCWLDCPAICQYLKGLPDAVNSGDVYARLT
ncbi:MAG: FkbM family methyltransferase [Pseudomonadota bacterium]